MNIIQVKLLASQGCSEMDMTQFVSVVLMIIGAFIAFFTWRTSQVAHDLSMLQQSLMSVLDSFEKRYLNEKYTELELLVGRLSPAEIDFRAGEHYVLVRTINYYLKPIAAWCEVALQHNKKSYNQSHRMFASIILSNLHSKQHIMLFILQTIEGRTDDKIRSHRSILKYVKQHIPEEWESTLLSNRTSVVTRLQNPPWV